MSKQNRPGSAASGSKAAAAPDSLRSVLALAALAAAIVIVFYPLTGYFFAQDDFTLILRSAFRGGDSLAQAVQPNPGQFRPLSKVLYFSAMHRLFGLSSFPYHVVSLLIHLLNAMLFYALLRRCRLARVGALMAAFLFALSTSFTNVVAWAACIQQLLGLCFGLLALILGIRGIERRSAVFSALSAACYALSLLSIEQTAALPLVLALYAYTTSHARGAKPGIAPAAASAWLPLAVMAAYAFFMLVWKRLPGAGPYAFHLGGNVIDNFLVYADWAYAFSAQAPFLTDTLKTGLASSHLLVLAVVLFNCARGRRDMVMLGCAYYVLMLLPVLPLENHTFLTHTYIPSFGLLMLLGCVVDDFHRFLAAWNRKFASYAVAVSFVLVVLISFVQIRKDMHTPLLKDIPLPRDYILRRATIAQTAYQDIMSRKVDLPRGGKFFMVFMGERSWLSDNVFAALGDGDAVRLFYRDPELEVFAHTKGDTLDAYSPENSQILFYDLLGHFYTDREAIAEGSAIGELRY